MHGDFGSRRHKFHNTSGLQFFGRLSTRDDNWAKADKKSKQGQFQIVDVVQLFDPICKMTKQIVNGNTIPSIVREAFRVSEEEKPGPVLLEIPEDIAAEKVELTDLIPPHERFYAVAGEQIIIKTAELIKSSKKPLILLGAGANRKEARRAISTLLTKPKFRFVTHKWAREQLTKARIIF